MTRSPDQGSLFGYISPVTGDVTTHPPLCACGECAMPVEQFEATPMMRWCDICQMQHDGPACHAYGCRCEQCVGMAAAICATNPDGSNFFSDAELEAIARSHA
jgi:hypothetical protein